MAPLLFRAWHEPTKNMVYPCDIHELTFEKRGRWHITNCKAFGMEYDHEINVVTGVLMQWTGLKDKNGKDIYEGDIVRNAYGILFEVIFQITSGCFEALGLGLGTVDHLYHVNEPEVLGNRYEHPELLP